MRPRRRRDGLRVTTAFGNDNRLTYTYGSAAAHAAAANYRRRGSALCASAASANLCLAATVATYLVVPNVTAGLRRVRVPFDGARRVGRSKVLGGSAVFARSL